jgi:hypothetical protein
MFGLKPETLLGLSVLSAIVITAGNLLATILKDFVFTRSLEKWKERQKERRELMSVYRTYRDPIVLAAKDLKRRLTQICDRDKSYPPDNFRPEALNLGLGDLEINSFTDPHFTRYRWLSTVYRLCAFFGWLELYRQDVTFLDTGQERQNHPLEGALKLLKGDEGPLTLLKGALADGDLNKEDDSWRDRLIFREEQRAIGEAMIASGPKPRVVIGYGTFCNLFIRSLDDENLWPLRVARNFFVNLEEAKDFRQKRLKRMVQHLTEVIDTLEGSNHQD